MSGGTGIPFGGYRLVKRIARGGMAEVFLARQRGLEGFNRIVALKRILPHLVDAEDFVRMFLHEARLAARLSHPNIVHIYDFGKVDEQYFIAMEYVDGCHAGTLIERIAEHPLPPALAARIGADACAGLHHAHQLKGSDGRPLRIVHRDISPPNLLVSFDGTVKLVDFGIAKAATAVDATQPGVVKGKFAYMSPEQAGGDLLDDRSDVFSLGLVLYELLSGVSAIDREQPMEAMQRIRRGEVPRIEEAYPEVPPALAEALGHALAVNPAERASALELGTALEAFIKESPELATSLQLSAWIRDHGPERPQLSEFLATSGGTQGTANTAAGTSSGATRSTSPGTVGAPSAGVGDARAAPVTEGARDEMPAFSGVFPHDTDEEPPSALAASPNIGSPRAAPGAPAFGEHTRTSHADTTQLDLARESAGGYGTSTLRTHRAPRWRAIAAVLAVACAGLIGAAAAGAWLDARSGAAPAPPERAGAEPRLGTKGASSAPDALAPPPDAEVLEVAPLDGESVPPDAAPPADAAPPPTVLTVITDPEGADVVLEGEDEARTTPTRFDDLEPGTHHLALSLEGYERRERDLTLKSGEKRTIEVALRKLREAPPRQERARRQRDRRAEKRQRPQGQLVVRTRPYSDVYIRDRKIGTTPFADVSLPAGTYTLTFRNPDHPPHKRRVTIRPGEETRLNFELP